MAALIWLAIGVILAIVEVLGAAGFLIGAAVAAIAMSLATWIFPNLHVVAQVIFFAIAAVVASIVYFRFFRSTDPTKNIDLHDKVGSMVGQQFVLGETLPADGEAKAMIGDTMWTVHSESEIEKGEKVRVVGGTPQLVEIEAVT